jgi:hypothetical protein
VYIVVGNSETDAVETNIVMWIRPEMIFADWDDSTKMRFPVIEQRSLVLAFVTAAVFEAWPVVMALYV